MRYQPLHDRILVDITEESSVTAGGLWVPDIAKNNKHIAFGQVIAVGLGRTNLEGQTVPLQVKRGDIVCYPRKAAVPLPIIADDMTETFVLMMREADVISVVHDMPQPSVLVDRTGAPLSMMPSSRAMPDVAAKNREELERAERAGFADPTEHTDEPNGMTG
jgi:chaperonin GroES